mgnify:FL=1
MAEYSIRTAGWEAEAPLGALLAISFSTDPFVRWILPDARDLIHDSQRHPRRAYAPAFETGSVFVIGDYAGAAVWLPPGAKADRSEEVAQSAGEAHDAHPAFPPEFPELLEKSAAYCPAEPHWYLGLLAVDPAHRGKGLGSRLLTHCLEIVDRDRAPAYLESTSPANLTLYERFGFERLAEVRVGTSPARYPMQRPSRT